MPVIFYLLVFSLIAAPTLLGVSYGLSLLSSATERLLKSHTGIAILVATFCTLSGFCYGLWHAAQAGAGYK